MNETVFRILAACSLLLGMGLCAGAVIAAYQVAVLVLR